MSKHCTVALAKVRNRRSGFSLLELMVAMTILAIALVPVAYFYSTSLQMVEKASIRTRALALAQERLAEVRQMPYERIRSNITPSREQLAVYADAGTIDTENDDWYGYDFAVPIGSNHSADQWAGMFFYPLPLDYNPYRPQTQGYNNALVAGHWTPNNPITGMLDAHVNINTNSGPGNAAGVELDYEYEPIGFYKQKVYNRSLALTGDVEPALGDNATNDRGDVRMIDRRTIPGIEPSMSRGADHFRVGDEKQLDNYEIYGRRTIILDVRPLPQDDDGDFYAADEDRDGGATATNPYPAAKGPDNKFQVLSRHGTSGKMVIVQVFWLPRDAEERYIDWDDMNHVELRTFISASNEDSNLAAGGSSGGTGASSGKGSGAGGTMNRNDLLIITDPS